MARSDKSPAAATKSASSRNALPYPVNRVRKPPKKATDITPTAAAPGSQPGERRRDPREPGRFTGAQNPLVHLNVHPGLHQRVRNRVMQGDIEGKLLREEGGRERAAARRSLAQQKIPCVVHAVRTEPHQRAPERCPEKAWEESRARKDVSEGVEPLNHGAGEPGNHG